MSGGAASAGGCLVPAVHAPPPLSIRDLTEAPRTPSVAFCIVQGSVLPFGDVLAMHRASASTAARKGAGGPFRFTCM
jgi:hypothetical protein